MISSIAHQGKIVSAKADFDWGSDLDTIFDLLSSRFDGFNDNGFYAHPQEVALREELAKIPTLAHLSEALRGLQAHGVVLTGLGLAGLPQRIRGYGPVKAKNLATVQAEEAALLARFRDPEAVMANAAE